MPWDHAPSEWGLSALLDYVKNGGCETGIEIGGLTIWVPARPMGFYSLRERFRLAWSVFKGEADALFWPGSV